MGSGAEVQAQQNCPVAALQLVSGGGDAPKLVRTGGCPAKVKRSSSACAPVKSSKAYALHSASAACAHDHVPAGWSQGIGLFFTCEHGHPDGLGFKTLAPMTSMNAAYCTASIAATPTSPAPEDLQVHASESHQRAPHGTHMNATRNSLAHLKKREGVQSARTNNGLGRYPRNYSRFSPHCSPTAQIT